MKWFRSAFVVFVCSSVFFRAALAIATLAMAVPAVFAAPRIEFVQPYWDFGIITNRSSLAHDYWVSNSGAAPLIIHRVSSTCEACLQASIEKTNLPPGAATWIHALLDLRLLNGSVSRGIIIDCNDPQNPFPELELTGAVVPLYQVIPSGPVFDVARQGDTIAIEICPLFQLRAPLSRVLCSLTNIQGAISPDKSGCWLLTLKAKNLPLGNETVSIVVRSSDTNDPPCSIDVSVRNPPGLEVLPQQLIFNPQAEEQTRILWLKQHGTAPLMLQDAVLPSDKFHCEINPDADGLDDTIYVTAWQLQSSAGQTNTLLLKCLDAAGHETDVKVPVLIQQP